MINSYVRRTKQASCNIANWHFREGTEVLDPLQLAEGGRIMSKEEMLLINYIHIL
jgi:hypothetical protein